MGAYEYAGVPYQGFCKEWADKLDTLLAFNERAVLTHPGKVSRDVAEKLAQERYAEFDAQRRKENRVMADKDDIAALEDLGKKLEKKSKKKKSEGKE